MHIPFQCLHSLQSKTMVSVFLVALALVPSLPGAQEPSRSKPLSPPLLLVLVRPTTFTLHIVRADAAGIPWTDLSEGDVIEAEPVLSPDGKKIAFTAVNADKSAADIYTMKVDGTGRTHVTHSPAQMAAMSPSWSPDGHKLVYAALPMEDQKSSEATLHVMDADGKNDKVIGRGMFPVWSKDNKITCTGEGGLDGAAYIMDADGKNRKKLAAEALIGGWSSDGKHLAYTNGSNMNLAHVLVADGNGAHPVKVTGTEFEHEYGAQWAADGKHLLFNRIVDNPIALGIMQVFAADAEGKNPKAITAKESGLMLSNGSGLLLLECMLAR